ncbi:MAG: response regulator, partial [Chthoniobacteraceae bacterium]
MSARILIIEDKQANLDLMSYLLKAFGHTVRTAMDGEEGFAALRRELPDIVVCDIHLPRLDGYEMARQIKADPALRHIPLVAVTAQAMVGDREKVIGAGFDGYISKPITPEIFVGQVEAFLDPALRSAPRVEPAPSEASKPTPHTKGALLLVVDDNAAERRLMHSIFDPSGYEVRVASTITESLQLARTLRPDLIVSDLNMPGGTGFDLLAAVNADAGLHGQRVVIITSTDMTEAGREIQPFGAIDPVGSADSAAAAAGAVAGETYAEEVTVAGVLQQGLDAIEDTIREVDDRLRRLDVFSGLLRNVEALEIALSDLVAQASELAT